MRQPVTLDGPRLRRQGAARAGALVRALALALLIAVTPLLAAAAQVSRGDPGSESGRLSLRLSAQLQNAQSLKERHPDQALAILEGLGEQEAGHPSVRLLKAQLCRQLGRGEDAEAILRSLVEEFPEADGYREELARTLFQLGRDPEAMQALEAGWQKSHPKADEYEEAAALLQSVNRFDLIEGIYRRGLAAIPPTDERSRLRLVLRLLDHLLLEDRAADVLRTLAGEAGRYKEPVLNERLFKHGEELIAELPEPRSLVALADSLAGTQAGPALAGTLRGLYLAAGEYEVFARRVLEARLHPPDRNRWLYEEGLRCLTEGAQGDAEARRRAAESIYAALLDAKPNEELAVRARWQLIRISRERDADRRLRGDPPTAAETEQTLRLMAGFREEHPTSPWTVEVLVMELRYLRETLGRADDADRLLRAWLANPDRADDTESLWALELEMGENLLAEKRFDEARGHYVSLVKTVHATELTGWARYRLAQLLVMDKQVAAAQDSLAALAKEKPGSPLANDALDLALLLAESQDWPATVQVALDGALILDLSSRPVEAAERLLAFAREFPDDEASPALLYWAGLLLERGLAGKRAIESWLLLADQHPKDFRAPQALEKSARLALRMGDRAQARELLERLVREHPDSPLRPGLRDLQESLAKDA